MQTKTYDAIVRDISPILSSTLTNAASAALIGLGLRRRRSASPVAWLTAGLAIGGTVAYFLAPADTRERLLKLFQRTGGGVGKRVGQLVGQQVGAHPIATAKVVEEARDLLKPKAY